MTRAGTVTERRYGSSVHDLRPVAELSYDD
jgi:hypothetical protein